MGVVFCDMTNKVAFPVSAEIAVGTLQFIFRMTFDVLIKMAPLLADVAAEWALQIAVNMSSHMFLEVVHTSGGVVALGACVSNVCRMS